jgi:hypothetical protein
MISERSPHFFNRDIALILFFSNTLRFLYWAYEPWETYLLGQAIAVFFVQTLIAILHFHYDSADGFTSRKYLSHNVRYYLNIRKIKHGRDFFVALLGFGVLIISVFGSLVWQLGAGKVCTATIVIANLADTFVSVPQVVRIVIQQNIEGASVVLVVQFLMGDWMKLIMFWATGTAWPFIFGALVQICVDSTVAVSFFWQRSRKWRSKSAGVDQIRGSSV